MSEKEFKFQKKDLSPKGRCKYDILYINKTAGLRIIEDLNRPAFIITKLIYIVKILREPLKFA